MSMITELINRLRKAADFRHTIGDYMTAGLHIEAADTIEQLAAKQRWIPVSERLPNKPNVYIVTDSKGDVVRFVFNDTESSREYWLRCAKAWMPLPEPYREDGDTE